MKTPQRAIGRPGASPPKRARHRRPPSQSDGVWLFGVHAVAAALANPARRCHRLVVTAEAAARRLPAGAVTPEVMTAGDLARLLPQGAVHQGVAVLVDPLPEPSLDAVLDDPPERAILMVLDQVTDPHNVGAIARSCAAFGALALVVTERHAPHATGTLAKAASGALEILPIVRVVNLARALRQIGQSGFWCLGLDDGAPAVLSTLLAHRRIALVLGAEGDGLRRLTAETCDGLARLPTVPGFAALNVANAAAVALYAAHQALPTGGA